MFSALREFSGCGKTTYIAKQVRASAERFGSSSVLVASLTTAAAAEAAGRDLPIPPSMVGTLHAHAYRCLDKPVIADSPKGIKVWNDVAPSGWQIGETEVDLDEAALEGTWRGETEGDELLSRYQLLRQMRRDRELWPFAVRRFALKWEAFKAETSMLDFTDLIETALTDVAYAPGMPSSILIDEAQDMSRLEMALVRAWSKEAEQVIVVGDPDQNLYEWRGADPKVFQEPAIPAERTKVLRQSYRVPRLIFEEARRWVRRINDRVDVDWSPREDDGEVARESGFEWQAPIALADAVEADVEAERSVMILASCRYMLAPVIAELKSRALPFWNPYRTKQGQWNPLRRGSESRRTAVDRVLAYLRPEAEVWSDLARLWYHDDVFAFADVLDSKTSGLRRGAKAWLKGRCDGGAGEISLDELLAHVFEDDALTRAFAGDLDWFETSLLKSKAKTLALPIEIARQRGGRALFEKPRCVVGTIHSVKGGEADAVYLLPDISSRAWPNWIARPAPIVRAFYVGMTRARHKLVLCGSRSTSRVDW